MPVSDDHRESMQAARDSVIDRLREAFLTGFAVLIPLLITLYVLTVAAGIIVDVLAPVEQGLRQFQLAPEKANTLVRVMAVLLLLLVTLLVGLFATFSTGRAALKQFDLLVERIPGLGAIYKSFRQMGDVMLESESGNFQEVKLVEFPQNDAYTLGFETTETPDPIEDAAGREGMRTLFLPLAPNPVMGGFLAHIPEEQIMDVDMTVEEGIRAVVTTGVGVAQPGPDGQIGLTPQQMVNLNGQQTTMANQSESEADDD